jgi:hypothetical protein
LKRIAAILLLGIFLFNWCGYRLVTSYLESKANTQLQVALDNNEYNESDLISIKIPSNLPYNINATQFEKVEGEVLVNGITYKYVKRRMQNDSLELLCIQNKAKMKVQNSRDNFFKLVNDLQHNSQNKKQDSNSNIAKNILSDYSNDQQQFSFAVFAAQEIILGSFTSLAIPVVTLSPQERPPDA